MNKLIEANEIAFLHADICLASPESYSLDEKRRICEGIDASTAEVEAAMREDFQSWPPEAQAKMLDLLELADPGNFAWWLETLVGKTPDAPPAA
ncbi:MAG: hypothetical protein IJ111_14790 [Eggerthellaceae bacterium]|nr:hypothetical protein [Eggerthellaceae bacterium]